jgi:hypothetical protein
LCMNTALYMLSEDVTRTILIVRVSARFITTRKFIAG